MREEKVRTVVEIRRFDQTQLVWIVFQILKGINKMGQRVLDKIAEVQADFSEKLAAAQAKIDEDFAEVKRQLADALAAGNDQAAVDALDSFKGTVDAALGAVDPDPNFPPAPAPEPTPGG